MQAVYEKKRQAFRYSTKNLWQHYARHHKDEYEKLMCMEKERQSADSKVKATCSDLKRSSTSDIAELQGPNRQQSRLSCKSLFLSLN